jgi:hypothetical protein
VLDRLANNRSPRNPLSCPKWTTCLISTDRAASNFPGLGRRRGCARARESTSDPDAVWRRNSLRTLWRTGRTTEPIWFALILTPNAFLPVGVNRRAVARRANGNFRFGSTAVDAGDQRGEVGDGSAVAVAVARSGTSLMGGKRMLQIGIWHRVPAVPCYH